MMRTKRFLSFILPVLIIAMLSLPSFAAAPSWPVLQSGNSGANVWSLQYLLSNKGYSVTVDGAFGSGTASVVKSFQTSNNLSPDGIVGSATWTKLVVTVQSGSNNSAVKALQYQLKTKYGYNVTVDGAFGQGTDSAVRSFQSSQGIPSDGIVGPTTWQYLIGGSGGSQSASVYFASGVNSSVVSTSTINTIKKMLANAGLSSCTITSTIRTPLAQATAMYENCESTGAAAQLEIYGSAGDQVINVYIAGKNAGNTRSRIIQAMVDKINALWPTRVSLHCVPESEYAKLNVIDISQSSIANGSAFETQLNAAVSNGSLKTYLIENGCYHIEVPVP